MTCANCSGIMTVSTVSNILSKTDSQRPSLYNYDTESDPRRNGRQCHRNKVQCGTHYTAKPDRLLAARRQLQPLREWHKVILRIALSIEQSAPAPNGLDERASAVERKLDVPKAVVI